MLAPVVMYSNEIQQPVPTTAVVGCYLHTRQAAPFYREQGSAG